MGEDGLREHQKRERRKAILAAARALLSRKADEDVSNDELATRAGVTPPTLYNLVGSRMALLTAIMNEEMSSLHADLRARSAKPPLAALEEALEQVVARFCADAPVFRQIVRRINGLELAARPPFDPHPLDVLGDAVARASRKRLFVRGLAPEQIARQIFLSFAGAAADWSVGWMTNEQFRAEALHGLHTTLAAACVEKQRERSLAALRKLGRSLRESEARNPRPKGRRAAR